MSTPEEAKAMTKLFKEEERLYRGMLEVSRNQENQVASGDHAALLANAKKMGELQNQVANVDIDLRAMMETWDSEGLPQAVRDEVEEARNQMGETLKDLMEIMKQQEESALVKKTDVAQKIQKMTAQRKMNQAYQKSQPRRGPLR